MSELYDLIGSRRMCRAYLQQSVPRAALLRILDAARKSPSAGHAQGVRFAVIQSLQHRLKIAEAVGEARFRERGFSPWFGSAPVHLVVASEEAAYHQRYSEPDKSVSPQEWPVPYPVLDAGKALMALYLAAEREGLSCGYLGPHSCPELVGPLGLPKTWRLMGLVTLGYRDTGAERPSHSHKRGWRPFEETVLWLS